MNKEGHKEVLILQFGNKYAPKFLSVVYGSGWDKGSFKLLEFRRTPLGWDFNIWRFMLSYDNYEKVSK